MDIIKAGANDLLNPILGAQEDTIYDPSKVDYLKTRVYLYKFAPKIIDGGSQPSISNIKNAIFFSGAYRDQQAQAESVLKRLRIAHAALVAEEPKFATGYNTAWAVEAAKALAAKLDDVIKMPNIGLAGPVRSDKRGADVNKVDYRRSLIIFDSTRNEDTATTQSVATNIAHSPFEAAGFERFERSATTTPSTLFVNDQEVATPNESLYVVTQKLIRWLRGGSDVGLLRAREIALGLIAWHGSAISLASKWAGEEDSGSLKLAALKAQRSEITHATKQFEVRRFIYNLDVADLYRFDISGYLAGYSTSQTVGVAGSTGTISGSANFHDAIIPLSKLSVGTPGPDSVRRPIFFPNQSGDYEGYDSNRGGASVASVKVPTVDPITQQYVSTGSADDLITRIAMAQTFEDNGGKNTSGDKSRTPFDKDVDRIEIAIRLRGIRDPKKKEKIQRFFQTGISDPDLSKAWVAYNAKKNSSEIAKDQEILSRAHTQAEEDAVNSRRELADYRGNLPEQLKQLRGLTDSSVDGISLSDLIQKRDFLSIFIYKHDTSADTVEDIFKTVDDYFFDKEALFMSTPLKYVLGGTTNQKFAMYEPEFNGFVDNIASARIAGDVNKLSITMIGSMSLFTSTQRVYSSTIFDGSIFDAAETMGESGTLNLFQNHFADKNPLQILTILLESLYLLRVKIPRKLSQIGLTDAQKTAINTEVETRNQSLNLPSKIMESLKLQAQQKKIDSIRSLAGTDKYVRDTDKVLSSFFDIKGMQAYNQYGEKVPGKTIAKGPKHLFNMQSFLYANVMRMRRFNVLVPSPFDMEGIRQGGAPSVVLDPTQSGVSDVRQFKKETDGVGGSVLEITPGLDAFSADHKDWKAYFLFLNDAFANFSPQVQTSRKVMDDVTSTCYLELYETPGGRMIFRTPQYNNDRPIFPLNINKDTVDIPSQQAEVLFNDKVVNPGITTLDTTSISGRYAQMITSDDVDMISSSYNSTVSGLFSKQEVSYGVDMIGELIDQLKYFYANGKLISQYGLKMGKTAINPNVRFVTKQRAGSLQSTQERFMGGVFHYCRFFLEYTNMFLSQGSVEVVGDPAIQAGRTFFDIPNQKFGYIAEVTKQLTVGQQYRTSFKLVAVRDAVSSVVVANTPSGQTNIPVPEFRRLPEMEDFLSEFTGGNAPVVNKGTHQASVEILKRPSLYSTITGRSSGDVRASSLTASPDQLH